MVEWILPSAENAREPHNVTVSRNRVRREPGSRSQNLFEKKQIANLEQASGPVILQRGLSRSLLQATLLVAPGVEIDLVQFDVRRDIK